MFKKIDDHASHQLGLITATQLADLPRTRSQTRWMVHRGVLIPIRFNVYRLSGSPISWEQTVLAAVLCAGPDAVLSHATAAAVWNLRHSDRDNAGIHITGPRQTRDTGITSHRRQLGPDDRTESGAIPITTPERTIIDVAGTLSAKQLGQCVDDAIRRQLVSLERLRKLVAATPAVRNRPLKPLNEIVAERLPGYRPDDSDFEAEMNRLWDELNLPTAKRQHRVTVDGHNYRIDRAIVEYKIGVEWDSDRFHTAPSDRDHDSNRRARLASAGWIIIPVTAHSEPALVAAAVLRAYRDRGGGPEVPGAV